NVWIHEGAALPMGQVGQLLHGATVQRAPRGRKKYIHNELLAVGVLTVYFKLFTVLSLIILFVNSTLKVTLTFEVLLFFSSRIWTRKRKSCQGAKIRNENWKKI